MNRLLIVAALAAFSSVASGQTVSVTLVEWKIIMKDTVPAGVTTFQISNQGTTTHAFHIKAADTTVKIDKESAQINKSQSGALTLTLRPGKYQVWCPLADLSHRNAGMMKTIVVVPKPPSPKSKPY